MSMLLTDHNSPRRIQFFVSSLEGGGAERVATLLCNYWSSCGHHVELVATFSGRGRCAYSLDERVRLRFLSDEVANNNPGVIQNFHRARALRKMLRESNADTTISFLTNVNVAVLILSWRLKSQVIVSERSYPPANHLSKFLSVLRRLSYPSASAVVVQTQDALDWLESTLTKAHGYVIPNPIAFPISVSGPVALPDRFIVSEQKVILAVGRLSVEKGHRLLLEAFAMVAEELPSWDLVILGEGDERQFLEDRAEDLEVSSRVHFPGFVGNVSDWYSRADVFAMTSQFEGFPNSLIEAMAHGLPVVCGDCRAGPRDIIQSGINGLLVPLECGVVGFSDKLRELMENEDHRARMGVAASEVRERFGLEAIGAQWDRLLECVQQN